MRTQIIGVFTAAVLAAGAAYGHGEGAPQPVDTTGLEPLGAGILTENPYRDNKAAIEIGASGYNGNCARCHGLQAKSGGMSPDLRELPVDAETDAWYISRVLHGATRDGRVRMPPFEGLLSQEAIWAIRAYIDAQPD